MRIPKSAGFVLVAVAFGTPLAAQIGKPIRTQAGIVQGVEANGVAVYKGIPFAAPPLGNLRWRTLKQLHRGAASAPPINSRPRAFRLRL